MHAAARLKCAREAAVDRLGQASATGQRSSKPRRRTFLPSFHFVPAIEQASPPGGGQVCTTNAGFPGRFLLMAISAQELPPGVVLKQSQDAWKGMAQIDDDTQQFHVMAGHAATA